MILAFGLMHPDYSKYVKIPLVVSVVVLSNFSPLLNSYFVKDYNYNDNGYKPQQTQTIQPVPDIPEQKLENIRQYKEYILAFKKKAKMDDIPVRFIHSIITCESGWRQHNKTGKVLKSVDNAVGLMQVLYSTAGDYGITKSQLDTAQYNLHAGMLHIKRLFKKFNEDLAMVATAYNLGEGNVERGTKLRNKETVHYKYCVMGNYLGADYLYDKCTQPYCLAIKRNSNSAGNPHAGVFAAAAAIQSTLKGYWRMTSGKDKFHKNKYKADNGHNKGLAFDFTARGQSSATKTVVQNIMKNVPDAKYRYRHYEACNGCTGEHDHFEFLDNKSAQLFLEWAVKSGHWQLKVAEKESQNKRVSLNYRNAPSGAVIEGISDALGIAITVPSGVKGRVTLSVHDMQYREVRLLLPILVELLGYELKMVGNQLEIV